MSKHDIGIDGKKNSRRMPITTAEIAARVRAGETPAEVAASVGATVHGIYRRFTKSGYGQDGHPRAEPQPTPVVDLLAPTYGPALDWIPDDPTPCHGQFAAFTSPNVDDHLAVRHLCSGCPVADECAAAVGAYADGTYAGVLYRDGHPVETEATA